MHNSCIRVTLSTRTLPNSQIEWKTQEVSLCVMKVRRGIDVLRTCSYRSRQTLLGSGIKNNAYPDRGLKEHCKNVCRDTSFCWVYFQDAFEDTVLSKRYLCCRWRTGMAKSSPHQSSGDYFICGNSKDRVVEKNVDSNLIIENWHSQKLNVSLQQLWRRIYAILLFFAQMRRPSRNSKNNTVWFKESFSACA
jgi:hypothetical protein